MAMVANRVSERDHWVPDVTSWVDPLLRCAVACSTTDPPTLTVEGVAVIDRD